MDSFFTKLLDLFSKGDGKTIIKTILFLLILLIVLPFFSDYFYSEIKLGNRINNLKDMSEIKIDDTADSRLKNEYESLLENYVNKEQGRIINYRSTSPRNFMEMFNIDNRLKFLSSSLLWLLFAFLCGFAKYDKLKTRVGAIILFLLLALGSGWIGTIIPTFDLVIINYVGVPLIQLLVLVLVGISIANFTKKKSKNLTTASTL